MNVKLVCLLIYGMNSYISESILGKIQESGFTIAMSKEITLSREQAEVFYAEHKDSDFFETLVENMSRFVEALFLGQ